MAEPVAMDAPGPLVATFPEPDLSVSVNPSAIDSLQCCHKTIVTSELSICFQYYRAQQANEPAEATFANLRAMRACCLGCIKLPGGDHSTN